MKEAKEYTLRVRLPLPAKDAVRQFSEEDGQTMSEFSRVAIRELIERRKRKGVVV